MSGPSARRRLTIAGLAAAAGGLATWSAWRRMKDPGGGGNGGTDEDAIRLFFALNLPDVSGKPTPLAPLEGSPILLNFWATWCAPCIEEMPELSDLNDEFGPRGLKVIGLGVDSPENIERFARQRPVSYPLLIAGAGGVELTRRFGNTSGGLPYTVLIGRDGRLRDRISGRFDLASLHSAVEQLATAR